MSSCEGIILGNYHDKLHFCCEFVCCTKPWYSKKNKCNVAIQFHVYVVPNFEFKVISKLWVTCSATIALAFWEALFPESCQSAFVVNSHWTYSRVFETAFMHRNLLKGRITWYWQCSQTSSTTAPHALNMHIYLMRLPNDWCGHKLLSNNAHPLCLSFFSVQENPDQSSSLFSLDITNIHLCI